MSAREDILRRIRPSTPALPLPEPYGPWNDLDDPVGLFVSRASAAGVEVVRPAGPEWGNELASMLRRRGVRTVAVWDAPLLDPIRTALGASALTVLSAAEHTKDWLAGTDAGITTADYAIALSGTLVLACDPRRPRSTSLLPPLHVAVLPQDRIVPTVGHLFAQPRPPLPSALTFITGPSRTADIELTVVKGVHGPVAVSVVLLP